MTATRDLVSRWQGRASFSRQLAMGAPRPAELWGGGWLPNLLRRPQPPPLAAGGNASPTIFHGLSRASCSAPLTLACCVGNWPNRLSGVWPHRRTLQTLQTLEIHWRDTGQRYGRHRAEEDELPEPELRLCGASPYVAGESSRSTPASPAHPSTSRPVHAVCPPRFYTTLPANAVRPVPRHPPPSRLCFQPTRDALAANHHPLRAVAALSASSASDIYGPDRLFGPPIGATRLCFRFPPLAAHRS